MKKIIPLLILLTLSALSIVAGPSNKHFFNGEKWVPEDFDPTTTTLLIKNFSYTYTNKKGKTVVVFEKEQAKLEKFMKENYPYPYEFTDDIHDDKYKNGQKYHYAITWGSNTTTYSNGTAISGINCYLYDNRKHTELPGSGRGTSYAIGIFSMTINTMVYMYEQRKK